MSPFSRALLGGLVCVLVVLALVIFSAASLPATSDQITVQVHSPGISTPTPFRPLAPTQPGLSLLSLAPSSEVGSSPLSIPIYSDVYPTPEQVQPELEPTSLGKYPEIPFTQAGSGSTPSLEPTLNFHGIDLDRHQRIEIIIRPPDNRVNHGKPIKISFLPGQHCQFGDQKGCVYSYKPSYTGNVIIVTIHSGVGGEGQRLRSALEGTGINRAGFSLKEVQANLRALAGATVTIRQGEQVVDGLLLGGVARIPARALRRYFRSDLSQILGVAADLDDEMGALVGTAEPILVLETCGWKMPGEPGSELVADTTGSVYLSIIR